MKYVLIPAVLSVILCVMVLFGIKAYEQAILYEEQTTELVAYQSATQQATRKLEKIAKSLLGDLYNDETQIVVEDIVEKQQAAMLSAKRYTLYFMSLLALILFSFFMTSLRTFTLFGSLTALVTLIFGLITPILMVTIHTEVEYLGDIVLSFESKGVIGAIEKLFEGGDVVVATVILLFSVVTPVLKVLSLLFISLFIKNNFAHGIVKFFKMIGKWSMVDVFVVAVFLVYLTANKGDVSRAEVEVGLYFFLAYVIVSMLVSLSADKMLHHLKSARRV
ncbi:MAG: paraquat-inducible protein A [Campylobacterota bacterium]|nr:paraquat-inducible protein A [Campylobacterota bacterium]